MKKRIGLIVPVFFAVALFFFIITFSISIPIYFRPFYYLHIDALSLTETGFTSAEIKEAYNAVLDYLTLPNREFSCGAFEYTASGAAHFDDCKFLFCLNTSVLLCSAVCLAAVLLLRRFNKIPPLCIKNRPAAHYSAIGAIFIPVIIGGLAAIDFEKAFGIFHSVFFAGKSNWEFDPIDDEIINVLPEQFFMNCAILIGAVIIIISALILIIELIKTKKQNQ